MTSDGSDESTPVERVRGAVRDRQLLSFVVLTLGVSWGWWGLTALAAGGGELPRGLLVLGAFGPPIAAALVTWASGGSLRAWAAQAVRWRVAPRWYVVFLGVPIVVLLGGVGVVLLLTGRPIDPSVLPGRLPLFVISFVFAFLVGGGQEELGWRGFMLPRLEETHGALAASLLVGAVWAVWHLPLFLLDAPRNETGSFLLYAVLVLGLSILLTWCYNSTDGSVLLAMLLHAGFNSSGAFVPVPMGTMEGAPAMIDVGITVGVWVVVIAVIHRTGTETLSRRGLPDATVAGREFDRGPGAPGP